MANMEIVGRLAVQNITLKDKVKELKRCVSDLHIQVRTLERELRDRNFEMEWLKRDLEVARDAAFRGPEGYSDDTYLDEMAFVKVPEPEPVK